MMWFHRHQWSVVQAGHYIKRTYYGMETAPGHSDITLVLYRCECGRYKTEQLNGLWEITPERDAEEVALRKIVT